MGTAAEVISIALGEVGYQEKATNASLDDPYANAGGGNWTKYGRDLAAAGYYNGDKNGYEWCDVFVDWCFYKAFGKTQGQLTEYQSGPLGAAVPFSAGYYKERGRYDQTPRPGDQVFYQEGGALVHTGIVVEVTPTQIVTVEGNKGNQVSKQARSRTSSYIAGYGHPNYDGSGGSTPVRPVGRSGEGLAVLAGGPYGRRVWPNHPGGGHIQAPAGVRVRTEPGPGLRRGRGEGAAGAAVHPGVRPPGPGRALRPGHGSGGTGLSDQDRSDRRRRGRRGHRHGAVRPVNRN